MYWCLWGRSYSYSYRVWLLFTIVYHPRRTVVGLNAESRRNWVFSMMNDPLKNGVLTVQTIRNNIMASTLLATTAITLSSLISVFVSNALDSTTSNFAYVFHQILFYLALFSCRFSMHRAVYKILCTC